MKKSSIVLLIVSLIVIVFSVTYAFFKIQIIGDAKNITVNSKDLKIVFNGGDSITGRELEQFNYSKTFTIENKSDNTYKYNIIIKDLVNTFKTDGFLLYKITSDNNGYSMSEFDDVPKSETATDKILVYSASIDAGVKQTYIIEFKYTNSADTDQSADLGAKLSGKLFITEGEEGKFTGYEKGTLGYKILEDNPTVGVRSNFDAPFTENTPNTIYKSTENNTDVYYFAGIENSKESYCEYWDASDGTYHNSLNEELVYFNSSEEYLNWLDDPDNIDPTVSSKEKCMQSGICKADYYILGLSEEECNNVEGEYYPNDQYLNWIPGNIKVNNWVKFGKYQNNFVKYRGYYSTTDTSYAEYSTMDECTSSSSANINCTEHKYANAGDDIYWRILKTNHDGSIRLVYSGTSVDSIEGHIGESKFSENGNSPKYVGYMYGDSDNTLEEARTNTNDSTIKTYIDNWYKNNLINYTKYLSENAIYCNDRELASGSTYSPLSSFSYAPINRLFPEEGIAKPSYSCTNINDAFSVKNTKAKLTYPIGLITADELFFAGSTNVAVLSTHMWLYQNSNEQQKMNVLFTMTPSSYLDRKSELLAAFLNEDNGIIRGQNNYEGFEITPVISLKSCVKYSSGDGTATNPYIIEETGSGC